MSRQQYRLHLYRYRAGEHAHGAGGKIWTYNYNALGQPTTVSTPNGMTTAYFYDTRNRMTKIEHKDGAVVKERFKYVFDTPLVGRNLYPRSSSILVVLDTRFRA